MTIAFLAVDAGKLDAAASALARAREAGADPVQLDFGSAVLRFRQGRLDEASATVSRLLAEHPDFAEALRLQAAIEAAKRR